MRHAIVLYKRRAIILCFQDQTKDLRAGSQVNIKDKALRIGNHIAGLKGIEELSTVQYLNVQQIVDDEVTYTEFPVQCSVELNEQLPNIVFTAAAAEKLNLREGPYPLFIVSIHPKMPEATLT